jgi:hypothetical protein
MSQATLQHRCATLNAVGIFLYGNQSVTIKPSAPKILQRKSFYYLWVSVLHSAALFHAFMLTQYGARFIRTRGTFCERDVLRKGYSAKGTFCEMAILRKGCFAKVTFCEKDVLRPGDILRRSFLWLCTLS